MGAHSDHGQRVCIWMIFGRSRVGPATREPGATAFIVGDENLIPPDDAALQSAIGDGFCALSEPATMAALSLGYAWVLLPGEEQLERRLVRWIGLGWTLDDQPVDAYSSGPRACDLAHGSATVPIRLPIAALAYLSPDGVSLFLGSLQPPMELNRGALAALRALVPLVPIAGAPSKADVRRGVPEPVFLEAPNLPEVPLLVP